MALRAPEPDRPVYVDEDHTVTGHWEPSRWWRVVLEDHVLAESSDPTDDFMRQAVEEGGELQRQLVFVPAVIRYIQAGEDHQ